MTNRQTIHDLLARLTEDRHTAEVDSLRRVIAEERARAERCRDEATALREMLDDAIESLELLAPVPPSSAVPTLHPVAVLDELAARNLHHHPNTAPITAPAAWEALRAVLDRARYLEAAATRATDLGVADTIAPQSILDELNARDMHTHPADAPVTADAAMAALGVVLDGVEAVLGRVADAGGPVMVDAGLVPDEDGFYPHDGTAWPACAPGDEVQYRTRSGYTDRDRSDRLVWSHLDRGADIIAWRPDSAKGGGQ